LGVGLLAVNEEKNRTLTALAAEKDARAAEQKAKETVQAKEKIANEREAETRAVLDFVEKKVFAAARPKNQEGGMGYDVKLADALTAALPFVETAFTHQPLIEARLRMTLGYSSWCLGKAKIAADQFQAARTIYTEHLGPDDPDTLQSMNNLANSYDNLGRHADALKLREETLALRKAKLGPDHPDTLSSMDNLAISYAAVGRHADAFEVFRETLAMRKAKLGPDHPETLNSMNNLAGSYDALGRHAEALKLIEETLAMRRAKLGPDHPDTLLSVYNIACCHSLWIPKASDHVKQADFAMEWLRKAVAAGFKNVDLIRQDSDLDALRDREDFKKLVAEVEAIAAKAKK
jgi:tetratricopeptide (TPR) repeat protein